jgi:citrate synthase
MDEAARIRSRIRLEEPEPDNPFAARAAWCHGYDVFGDMLGRARWADMIHLLFRGEAPSSLQAEMLDLLAVALADPGPRDPSVHAAMCGGVGGSPAAASLMAALAVGAGASGGARDLALAMEAWERRGGDPDGWDRGWSAGPEAPEPGPAGIWPAASHPPGFDPHGVSTAMPVRQLLARFAALDAGSRPAWLLANLPRVEAAAGLPLSLAGAAAAALCEIGFTAREGEMLFLILRLPGAAAHALEQSGAGHKRFPFHRMRLEEGPAPRARAEAVA